ncbi:hypothetical protein KDH_27610 [Dictyobacter sp. S3.2.2.5]|uniref:Uncharacterized protein n=1 Tax=Dictyobacter halimunensis TaxID=3026934 RepID=A0ABQ6FQB2_9CHLR|nr:hypothetical protein KDH_27610 [Dictyobacter sp. S3.2.2.5]
MIAMGGRGGGDGKHDNITGEFRKFDKGMIAGGEACAADWGGVVRREGWLCVEEQIMAPLAGELFSDIFLINGEVAVFLRTPGAQEVNDDGGGGCDDEDSVMAE